MQKLKALFVLACFTVPLAGCIVHTHDRGRTARCGHGTHFHKGRCVANR